MFDTMIDALSARAREHGDEPVFAFVDSNDDEYARITFAELDAQARGLAVRLADRARPGDRALMLYEPGPAFVTAFFGCLYAGMIAVPLSAPRRRRSLDKLVGVAVDSDASVVLMDTGVSEDLGPRLASTASLADIPRLITDAGGDGDIAARANDWRAPAVTPDTIALLQYTSGSTGFPKGVCVSHGNLVYNAEMVNAAFGHGRHTTMAGWLPLFHDMGLVGYVIQPVYNAFLSALMSPLTFLQDPLSWLRMISRYKATTAGGPNFGYQLCANKFRPEYVEGVDLSSWTVAFNGAEPVRAETLREFSRVYEPYGFEPRMFHPCYGMAEATLIVAGGGIHDDPVTLTVDANQLERGRAVPSADAPSGKDRTLVGCGRTILDQQLRIVDPNTRVECADGSVGEIWLSGDNISAGYWNKPIINEEIFGAHIAGSDAGPFLRTGDLGFVLDGELYIAGRRKDVIIIKGRNLYPQDIELAVESSHPAFAPGGGAAFAIDKGGEERVVVAHEVRRAAARRASYDELLVAARRAVAREFDVTLLDLVVIPQATIPKTSSGKVRRHQCRELYQRGALTSQPLGEPPSPSSVTTPPRTDPSAYD